MAASTARCNVVPLSGDEEPWSFETPFGSPITAPAAVCDGRIYFGGEDGYLYVLGPGGNAELPTEDPEVAWIRSPLTGAFTDEIYNWYTNYGDSGCTNANDQGIEPHLRMRWVRRVEGTVKHIPVCGGGRMYTHTAEGQIMAVEQETGRLLWRRYWPGVHLSFTSPLYHRERLLVPQAGLRQSILRCLDAATGELLLGRRPLPDRRVGADSSRRWCMKIWRFTHPGRASMRQVDRRRRSRGAELPRRMTAGGDELYLLAQQPVLSSGQSAADLGVGH